MKCTSLASVLLAAFFMWQTDLALAQSYRFTQPPTEVPIPKGAWDGEHELTGVYCIKFFNANEALRLTQGFMNAGAIHFTRVIYPDALAAYIVASTIPNGRSADEEIARLLSIERSAESAYQHNYNITESGSEFGTVIGLRINDVADVGKTGPFPLVRPVIRPARPPIESMSVHRIFARGPDRFEVAVFQAAPRPAAGITEAAMAQDLTARADQLFRAFQLCTESLPIRMPR